MKQLWNELVARLSGAGDTIWTFGLRLILGYEYLESGITKYQGNNWFGSIQDRSGMEWWILLPLSQLSF